MSCHHQRECYAMVCASHGSTTRFQSSCTSRPSRALSPCGKAATGELRAGGRPRRTCHAVVRAFVHVHSHTRRGLDGLFSARSRREAAAPACSRAVSGTFVACSPGHDGAITAMPSVLAASRVRSSVAITRSTPSRCAVAADWVSSVQLEWQQPTSGSRTRFVDAQQIEMSL